MSTSSFLKPVNLTLQGKEVKVIDGIKVAKHLTLKYGEDPDYRDVSIVIIRVL